MRQELLGNEHGETAVSLSDSASVLRLNGDLDGAEELLRQSLELNRKLRGEGHAMTATTTHDAGVVAASKGDLSSSEALFSQGHRDSSEGVGVTITRSWP